MIQKCRTHEDLPTTCFTLIKTSSNKKSSHNQYIYIYLLYDVERCLLPYVDLYWISQNIYSSQIRPSV